MTNFTIGTNMGGHTRILLTDPNKGMIAPFGKTLYVPTHE